MTGTRRDVLLAGSSLTLASVAGCLGTFGSDDDRWAYASFFTLYDFTRNIVDPDQSVENAVPSGQHGHEWQPSMDMLPNIVESDVFIYLGTDGFQPWVDDALEQLERNHGDAVALIDVLSGIELLEYDDRGDDDGRDHGSHGHSHEEGHHGDTELAVRAITLSDRETGSSVVDAHDSHWHGGPLEIPPGDRRSFGVRLDLEDGDELAFGTGEYALDVRVDATPALVEVDSHGDHLHIRGEEDGTTVIVVQLTRDGAVTWESPPLEVQVGDGGATSHDHEHDHGHSHGEYDAKFFSDPVMAQAGVKNIRDGLIELDPENEPSYEENAAAYLEELEALHERFEEALSDREHDHVVLAGHDSFQYLAERYGFEIHTPVGLSPNDSPSGGEIAATVEFVEEHGIEYVLWDYFDGDDLAETIATEADTVTDTVMVSPAESAAEEWNEAGHGDYLGQMAEINLPAFRTALGAE